MQKDIVTQDKMHIVHIDDLVPPDHLVRKLNTLDFSSAVEMCKHFESKKWPGLSPEIVIKHMLYCFLFDVSPGSMLENDLPANMAYRFFLGFDLMEQMPLPDIINRVRLDGPDVWDTSLAGMLRQCAERGLPHERGSAWTYTAN